MKDNKQQMPERIGKYRIKRHLGEGGFSDVYLAQDEQAGEKKKVAIKLLKAKLTRTSSIENFINEARSSLLSHSNIIKIHDFGVEHEIAYIIMDYISKGSLRDQYPEGSTLPLTRIVDYVKQIAKALQYAHDRRIIHRDIKPENILLRENGEVILTDFGISSIDQSLPMSKKYMTGTAKYMAPEQLEGRFSPASDQYSLGIVVYEWLCGATPFNGSFAEICKQHAREIPPSLQQNVAAISPAVEQVILKSLAKDPAERFESVQAFASALENAAYGSIATSSPKLQSPFRRTGKKNSRIKVTIALLTLIAIIVAAPIAYFAIIQHTPSVPSSSLKMAPIKAPDGELIGISTGDSAFDTDRPDGNLKRQAAERFKVGDIAGAKSFWQQAITQDSNDAETLIYQEDQRVLESHRRYFTLVASTILTGDLIGTGRSSLQGAFVAQQDYNHNCKLTDCIQMRLLIANSGTGDKSSDQIAYTNFVLEQIVQAKQSDASIIGILGPPFSYNSAYITTILNNSHLPLVSPNAFFNAPVGNPAYIFSVAPSNTRQGKVGANYAEKNLHAKRAAIFVDSADFYSQSLAEAFSTNFTADGNTVVEYENYRVGQADTIIGRIQETLSKDIDLIYFAGHSSDVAVLLTNLPLCKKASCIPILGGDALYELDYPPNTQPNIARLHFTAFAYPDEWMILAPQMQDPPLLSLYEQIFDPKKQHPNTYGYSRVDSSVILSYDAMLALLNASIIAFDGSTATFTSEALQKALISIHGQQAMQGVSGYISFGQDGNALNKMVIVLNFNSQIQIHYVESEGCFQKPLPTATPDFECQ